MPQLLAHLFGDYILQSDWMAQGKTKASLPALAHALLYSLCFVPLLYIAAVPEVRTFIPPDGPLGTAIVRPGGLGWSLWYVSGGAPAHFRWLPWLVIFSTHLLIDRFRLARYVVWAKNWLGPWTGTAWSEGDECEVTVFRAPTPPLSECPTGYPPSTPIWLSTWLLIIADNTLHLAINYAALRWL